MNTIQTPSTILVMNHKAIKHIFERYNVRQVRIFGSVARREDNENSDIDFLVDLPADMTMLEFGRLCYDLRQVISIPFDMLTYSGLNPAVLERFLLQSISLEEVIDPTISIEPSQANADKQLVIKNLKSVIWVTERITNALQGIDKELFYKEELLQDAVTRNIQLLAKVCSQIPEKELKDLKETYGLDLQQCIPLKDTLFMNVDLTLLWNTLISEIVSLRTLTEDVIKSIITQTQGK